MPAFEGLLRRFDAQATANRRDERREDEHVPGKETLVEIEASTGTPLETGLRHELEAALGEDLTDVRVHATPAAARAARRLSARAFTIGRNVYLSGVVGDRALLAHEVAHTVQQRGAATSGPLEVSRPGDTHEREAESFAERFARGDHRPSRLTSTRTTLQRDVDPDALAERQRKWDAMLAWATRSPSVRRAELDAMIAGSRPQQLPGELREELGARLGNIDDVRIHSDAAADAAARALDAEAFTVGRDIYFAAGKYDPSSATGRHLIAHEATHAVQHAGALSGTELALSSPGDAHEMQADEFADEFVAAGPRRPAPAPKVIAPDHPAAPRMIAPVRFAGISRRSPFFPRPSLPSLPSLPSTTQLSQISVPDVTLFPLDIWRKDFEIINTSVPLAKGIIPIGSVPVTYDAGLKLNASSFLTAAYGPGKLENLKVQLSEAERAAIVAAPDRQVVELNPLPWGPSLGIGPNIEDKVREHILSSDHSVSGVARMSAKAGAGILASATAEGSVHALDMFGGGVFAGLTGSVGAEADAKANISFAATYNGGKVTVTNLTLGAEFEFDLNAKLNAHAGFFVEVKLPTIPFVTEFVDEVSSWPVIGWVVPKWSDIKWRKDFRKDWKLVDKKVSRKWVKEWKVIASGASPSASHPMSLPDESAYDLASMVKELTSGNAPGEDIPDQHEGPGKDLEGAPHADVAGTRQSAKAQIKSAKDNIKRERKWNKKEIAKALVKIKKQKAKAKAAKASSSSAGARGGGRGAPALAMGAGGGRGGGGGGDDKVPAEEHKEKLEARDEKLEKADTGAENLEQRVPQVQSEAETKPDGVHHTRAQEGYQNIADNADKLGQAVGGYGDKKEEFERPVEPPDPDTTGPSAADSAEAEKARLEARKVLDEVGEKIDKEIIEADQLWHAATAVPSLAGYRTKLDSYRADFKTNCRKPLQQLNAKYESVPERHAEKPLEQAQEYRDTIIVEARELATKVEEEKKKAPTIPTADLDRAIGDVRSAIEGMRKTITDGLVWATKELREVTPMTTTAPTSERGALGKHVSAVKKYQARLEAFSPKVGVLEDKLAKVETDQHDLALRILVMSEIDALGAETNKLRPDLNDIQRPERPVKGEEQNLDFRMRFQVQWDTKGDGPTFSENRYGMGTKGVTVSQAVDGLNQVLAQVTPEAAKTAAQGAHDEQVAFVRSAPPAGLTQNNRSWSKKFKYGGYTDARVDVENMAGHNLRE